MLLIMVTSLVTLSSCSNDDDNSGNGGSAPSGTLVAKVDGTNYQSATISSSATVANGGQNLIIIASNSDGNGFAISIFGYSGPGTYPLTGADPLITNTASYTETDISNPMNTQIWSAPFDTTEVGSVVIEEETDSNIKGTFEFTGMNSNDNSTKVISEGAFDLDKQTI